MRGATTASVSGLRRSSADRWCAAPIWPMRSARKRDGRCAELGARAGLGGAADLVVPTRVDGVVRAHRAGADPGGGRTGGSRGPPLLSGLDGGDRLLGRRLLLDSIRAGVSRRRRGRDRMAAAGAVLLREGAAP